jgi:hypothetical protein
VKEIEFSNLKLREVSFFGLVDDAYSYSIMEYSVSDYFFVLIFVFFFFWVIERLDSNNDNCS